MFAVVKANAYGHGLLRAADAFADADGFAVLDLESAVQLRDAGHNIPILLLEGFFEAPELIHFAEHGLTAVVHSLEQVEALERAPLPRAVDVFLKLNSGMNRLGLVVAEFAGALSRLQACANVGQIVLMTHFACMMPPSSSYGHIDEHTMTTAAEARTVELSLLPAAPEFFLVIRRTNYAPKPETVCRASQN